MSILILYYTWIFYYITLSFVIYYLISILINGNFILCFWNINHFLLLILKVDKIINTLVCWLFFITILKKSYHIFYIWTLFYLNIKKKNFYKLIILLFEYNTVYFNISKGYKIHHNLFFSIKTKVLLTYLHICFIIVNQK